MVVHFTLELTVLLVVMEIALVLQNFSMFHTFSWFLFHFFFCT